MKKILALAAIALSISVSAQFGTVDKILDRLEANMGVNKTIIEDNIENKRFVNIKDFEDHTERNFILLNGNNATFVEMFDDKSTGETSSNVFSGDVKRKKNIISLRCDKLEGEKIALAVVKTLYLTKQEDILYLLDVNSRERWIEESSYNKALKNASTNKKNKKK